MSAPANRTSTRNSLSLVAVAWAAAIMTGWVLLDTAVRYTVQTKLTLVYHDGRVSAPPGLSAHELTYVAWLVADAFALACAIVGILGGLCYLAEGRHRVRTVGYALGRRWLRLGLAALTVTVLLVGAGGIRYLPMLGVSPAGEWAVAIGWGLVSLAALTWVALSVPAMMVRPGRPDFDPLDRELAGERPIDRRPPELDPDVRGQRWPGTARQLIEVGGFWRTIAIAIGTCVLPVAAAATIVIWPERTGSVDGLPALARSWVFAVLACAATLILAWSGTRLAGLPQRVGLQVATAPDDDGVRDRRESAAGAILRPGDPSATTHQHHRPSLRVRGQRIPATAAICVVCVLAMITLLTYSTGNRGPSMPDEQVLSAGSRVASAAEMTGDAPRSIEAVQQLADGRMATVTAVRNSNGVAVSSQLCDPGTGTCTAGAGANLPQRRLLDGLTISNDGTWALVTGQESVTSTGAVEVTSCSVDYCTSPQTQRLEVPARHTSADSDNWDLRAQVASWPGGFTVVGWFTDYGGAAPSGTADTRTSPAYLWQCPDGECTQVLEFTVPANAEVAVAATPNPAVIAVPTVATSEPYSAVVCADANCSRTTTVSIPATDIGSARPGAQIAVTGFALTPDARPVLTTRAVGRGSEWLTVCLTEDCEHHTTSQIATNDPMPAETAAQLSVSADGTIATATMTSDGDLMVQLFSSATGAQRGQAVVAHFGETESTSPKSSGNPWDLAISCLGPSRVALSWTGWYGDSGTRAHSAVAIVQLDLDLPD